MAGYIYSVYRRLTDEGSYEVRRTAITKETPLIVTTEGSGLAFGCQKYHQPSKVHRTPEEARAAFRRELVETRARLVERIARIDAALPLVPSIPEAEDEDRR